MSKIFFKGLNEIRAIAALSVLFHHIELYKFRESMPSIYSNSYLKPFISSLGEKGVFMFFVLSGFLITYLLLTEKTKFKKINIKKFYIRRILRIWPLYYLIVVISFFIVPFLAEHIDFLNGESYYFGRIERLKESFWFTLFLYVFFVPNLALHLGKLVVGASQSWSVGVEEQFYLIWPQIIQRVGKKVLPAVFILFIVIYPKLYILLEMLNVGWSQIIKDFVHLVPIHFMSLGALGAYFLYYYKSFIDRLFSNHYLFLINLLIFTYFLVFEARPLLFGITFAGLLLFIIRDDFKFNLRSKWLDKVGKISYGVYMYHPLMMFIVFGILHNIIGFSGTNPLYHTLAYLGIGSLTFLVSHLSFKYFEKRFIKLKNKKFTVV